MSDEQLKRVERTGYLIAFVAMVLFDAVWVMGW